MSLPTQLRHAMIMLLLGPLCTPHAKAGEQRIECPELAPNAVQITNVPLGWTARVPSPLRLVSAGVMFGPPARMAVSKPDASSTRGGKTVVKWIGLDGAMPGGKWMSCWYGADQDVVFSRPIAENTTECAVTHSKDAQKRLMLDISCRS